MVKDSYKEITARDITELCKQTIELQPAFADKEVAVIVFSSVEYLPMAAIVFQSIIKHADPQRNYDLILLCSDLPEKESQEKLSSMIKDLNNFSLRVVDGFPYTKLIYTYLKQEDFSWSLSVCLQLFVPLLCRKYEKVVCLAADVLVNTDIAKLYDMELANHPIASATTFGTNAANRRRDLIISHWPKPWEYENVNSWRMPVDIYEQKLGLSSENPLFNGDVLLLNISLLNREEFVLTGLNLLFKRKWRSLSEAVYCKAYSSRRLSLDYTWNCSSSKHPYGNNIFELSEEECKEYAGMVEHAKIIHFIGSRDKKPWVNPAAPLGWLWWGYARETPFYEQLLSMMFETEVKAMVETHSHETEAYAKKMYNESRKIPSLKRKMRFLRVVRQFTFGKTRKRLKEKERALKTRIREFRAMVR